MWVAKFRNYEHNSASLHNLVQYFLGKKMDLLTVTLGLGVIGAAAFMDVRGLDWAQRRFSEKLSKEAQHYPLVRDFPSSKYEISMSETDAPSDTKM